MRFTLPCWLVGLTLSVTIVHSHADDGELLYEIAPGLKAASAVKPGLVKHPMMITLDDQGRLFVAESTGVNLNDKELLEQRPHSIRMLEDTDGDGVYDRATVFADGLTFPQGVLWVDDSLYVATPPGIWKFSDKDQDGVAEAREEIATGFRFTGNAADVHGPFLHPNGRLYWAHGRKGFAVPDKETGELLYEGKGARIWSANLDGSDLRWVSGGGMDNPVEVDFTDEGEVVGTVNLFYGRPRGDTLTYFIHGGVYPRFDQGLVIAEFPRTGDLLPPIHNFGHEGVSGMSRYRSGQLNPDWKDQWLVTHFNNAKVTRTRVRREGAGFGAEDTETIFQILNPDSHVTDVMEDRNGDLLVVDTGGWFRIGCPTSQIAKPEVSGGIYRISRQDAAPYEPRQMPDWSSLATEEVGALLDAEEPWLQEKASEFMAIQGHAYLPELEMILTEPGWSVRARRNALWTLARMNFSEATDWVAGALKDEVPGVRQVACHVLGITRARSLVEAHTPDIRDLEVARNRELGALLADIVRGDEPAVAREAATALGLMREAAGVGAISGRLGRTEDDAFLRHALVYALVEIGNSEETRLLLNSENPATITGALLALAEMPEAELRPKEVLAYLDAAHGPLRAAATTLVRNRPDWTPELVAHLNTWGEDITQARRDWLMAWPTAFFRDESGISFLMPLLTGDQPENRRLALTLLASASPASLPQAAFPVIQESLAQESDNQARGWALDILASTGGKDHVETLKSLVASDSVPRSIQVRAARVLTKGEGAVSGEVLALLLEVLKTESSPEIRSRALGVLASSPLQAEQRAALLPLASNLSPAEVHSIFTLFGTLKNPEEAAALLDTLLDLPTFGGLDHDRLRATCSEAGPEALSKLDARIARLKTDQEANRKRIEELAALVATGDVERGRLVFNHGKGTCIACHRVGEMGGVIGPDLSTLGRIRTATDVIESVLYPHESISRDFETFEFKLKDASAGPRVGVIQGQSADSYHLVDMGSLHHRLPVDAVASITPMRVSLMPAGLEQTLTAQELSDLVAYLLSLK